MVARDRKEVRMKKFFYLGSIIVLMLVFAVGCNPFKKPDTLLVVAITSNPQGGNLTSSVSCTFTGTLETSGGGLFASKTPDPITATVEWWWENYYHEDQGQKKSETFTFSTEDAESETTTYAADSGYVLLNYWWVKISWTDGDDTPHTLESSKAYCSYSSSSMETLGKKTVIKLVR